MAQVMQVDKGENDEMEASTNEATLCDKEEIVSKLQRMSLTKWNDVMLFLTVEPQRIFWTKTFGDNCKLEKLGSLNCSWCTMWMALETAKGR